MTEMCLGIFFSLKHQYNASLSTSHPPFFFFSGLNKVISTVMIILDGKKSLIFLFAFSLCSCRVGIKLL